MSNRFCLAALAGLMLAMTSASSAFAGNSKDKEAFIANAKQQMATCEQQYRKFRTDSWAAEKAWEAAYDAERASSRLTGKPPVNPAMEQVEPYHKTCAEKAKKDILATAKAFIKSFKGADGQKNARDMVAQWVTAMDAIGNESAKAESAKFETLANGLLLDL